MKTLHMLEDAISPQRFVEILAEKGIQISERALRQRARDIGACRIFSRQMFFTPDDVEMLLNDFRPAISPFVRRSRTFPLRPPQVSLETMAGKKTG